MKQTKFLSGIVLVATLLMAACSPAGSANAVSKLQALASEAQAAMATKVPTAPITNAAAQSAPQAPVALAPTQPAPTATPAALIPVTSSNPVPANAMLLAFEGTMEQVYNQVNPSVVNIQVESGTAGLSTGNNNPLGQSQGVQEALGSGFVWDMRGHIVTNNHVVEGADKITVTFASGTTVTAKVVGADPNADLAVIQVSAAAGELHPVTLADSTQVKVGELAIAIGNPFGLSGTMTEGIVSALSRSLPVQSQNNNNNDPFSSQNGQSSGATYSIPDIIQTDAAINPGNSGGVLVNDQGQVLGVTAAIQSSSNSNSGIGFVIPSAIVNRVVPSLIKTGTYKHPYIGITGTSLDSDLNAAMNLKANQRGVLIIDVGSGTPAEQAGLRPSNNQAIVAGQTAPVGGDIITAVNGHAINSIDDLTSYLFDNTQVGQTVTLTILRQGHEQTVKVTLGALPSSTGQ